MVRSSSSLQLPETSPRPRRSTGERSLTIGIASLHDSSGSPISPAVRSASGFTFPRDHDDNNAHGGDRRPSVDSISSQSSRSSTNGKFRKKLQGFFGDEFHTGVDAERPTTSHLHANNERSRHHREGVDGSSNASEKGPDQSRPDTAPPSSDITPWLYQSFDVASPSSPFFYVVC